MVKVQLRWCIANPHSGCPFVYEVPPTTTLGAICEMVKQTNNEWYSKNWAQHQFKLVKICGPNNTHLNDNIQISQCINGDGSCVLIFSAG